MDKILVLGTKSYDFDLFNQLKYRGLLSYFCGITKSRFIPKQNWIQIDYTNTLKIKEFLDNNLEFKYVIPGSNDLAYISVCELIEKYNFKSKINIDSLTNAKKYLFKSKFRDQKIYDSVLAPKLLDIKAKEKKK